MDETISIERCAACGLTHADLPVEKDDDGAAYVRCEFTGEPVYFAPVMSDLLYDHFRHNEIRL